MTCSVVYASLGEYLDCEQKVNDEKCYTDRDDFREDVENILCDDFEGTDEQFEAKVDEVCSEYDPYWKKCIILWVNN